MPIKVKVNVPFDIYTCLINDMASFEFFKQNGSINKNKFINILFKNFYKEFSSYEKSIFKQIDKIILDKIPQNKKKKINYALISLINDNNYIEKYYNDCSFQFIISKENEKIFKTIEMFYLQDRSLSQYFREMFISYASKKQDKRESIIFKDMYEKARFALESKKRIILSTLKGESYYFEPYSLQNTKEELYNYLIGIIVTKNNNRFIATRKLYKVSNIEILEDDVSFSKEEIKLLDKTIENGAQVPINKEEISVVELTKNGKKLFNDMYLNRPIPLKIEDNKYFFDCSTIQIEFYFFKFGEDAKILQPSFLVQKFYTKYKNAIENYHNEVIDKNKISN